MSEHPGRAPGAASGDAAYIDARLCALVRPESEPYAARAGRAQRHVRALLEHLGQPQRGLPVIHIAGSKGKGTTALLCEALAESCGLRTGTFTSPHLQRWTERFRIGGREITPGALRAALDRVLAASIPANRLDPSYPVSFFEVLTATALHLFRAQGVELAILEAGLGARDDATGVVAPRACCITSVEMEHVDKLGPGLRDIARHKAGVLRAGVPAAIARLPAPAREEVALQAARIGAPLLRLGHEIGLGLRRESDAMCMTLALGPHRWRLRTRLAAPHLARDAALAVACLHASGMMPAQTLARAVPEALAAANLPGRVEIMASAPWLVVDGAHTRASLRALARALRALPAARFHLLVSLSGDKAPSLLLRPLLDLADEVTVTRADPQRSRAARAVAAELAGRTATLRVLEDPHEALALALSRQGPRDLLCATGSVYMAGLARSVFAARLQADRRQASQAAPGPAAGPTHA